MLIDKKAGMEGLFVETSKIYNRVVFTQRAGHQCGYHE